MPFQIEKIDPFRGRRKYTKSPGMKSSFVISTRSNQVGKHVDLNHKLVASTELKLLHIIITQISFICDYIKALEI